MESNNHKFSRYILYNDAKNLYDWAMAKYLPFLEFKFLTHDEIDETDVSIVWKDNSQRYMLEVGLYPKELRELHKFYPITTEKNGDERSMLSNNWKENAKK